MPVAFYMDIHVPQAITEQLRRRGVDVLTAVEDKQDTATDVQLLQRAHHLGRVIFSQDLDFFGIAQDLQAARSPFSGILFGHQLKGTIGQFVNDLELIAKASEPEDWADTIAYLPFKSS